MSPGATTSNIVGTCDGGRLPRALGATGAEAASGRLVASSSDVPGSTKERRMDTFHVDSGRTSTRGRWRLLAVLVICAASATGCATSTEPEEVSSVQQALCSASQQCSNGQTISCSSSGTSCDSGQDEGGLYVDCGSGRQYCPSSPSCTCGTERYWVFVFDGHGSTCSQARSSARAKALAQTHCTYGACNQSVTTACELDPNGGFIGEAEYYYSCMSC